MSVDQEHLDRALATAQSLEQQGYFEKVRQGNQKAASLFARLVAYTLNPDGDEEDFGCLSKSPGETQVDGFAEDAIVFGNDPDNRENVVDLVSGAGAPDASIPDRYGVKPRREHNRWVKPELLTAAQLKFLRPSGVPPPPPPRPAPTHKPYPGDHVWDAVGVVLFHDYSEAGQGPNPQMGRWFGRTIWDATEGDETGKVLTVDDSITKHRGEWRAELRLPPAP